VGGGVVGVFFFLSLVGLSWLWPHAHWFTFLLSFWSYRIPPPPGNFNPSFEGVWIFSGTAQLLVISHFWVSFSLYVETSLLVKPFIWKCVCSSGSFSHKWHLFSYERFCTKTRFETEAEGYSEMAYWLTSRMWSKYTHKNCCDYSTAPVITPIVWGWGLKQLHLWSKWQGWFFLKPLNLGMPYLWLWTRM